MRDLLDPKKTPRVPKEIRKQAYWALRHYPGEQDMSIVANEMQEVFEKDEEALLLEKTIREEIKKTKKRSKKGSGKL